MTDTPPIAALHTPPGRGGIAVIVLSGPAASDVLEKVFRPLESHRPGRPGRLQLGVLLDAGGARIDEAIVCQVGEAVEINIHGGPAAARAAMRRLVECGAAIRDGAPSPALAEAHPAWDNPGVGREMLALLPTAPARLAVEALSTQWSGGLSRLAAETIADPAGADPDALRRAAAGLEAMRKLLDPPEVVLAGPPNAGKSSLANLLVGRRVSVVHDRPGTTRDWVREPAVIDGVAVWLTDTAGIWTPARDAPTAEIDAESVRRARQRVEQADLVVVVETDMEPAPAWLAGARTVFVRSKCDLDRGIDVDAGHQDPDAPLPVSAVTGQGVDELRSAILRRLDLAELDPARPTAFTPRQARLLTAAADALDIGDAATAGERLRQLLRGE